MTSRSPKNLPASIHQRLNNVAHTTGRTFNDVLQHYALERILYRLSVSKHGKRFVLKGALLLRHWDLSSARPTRDIDLLGRTDNDVEDLKEIIRDVCDIQLNDGLVFETGTLLVNTITDDAAYQGVRIEFHASLGNAVIPVRIDIGFGDQITPNPRLIEYPATLDMPRPRLLAYPPETVIAEKLQIMIRFGLLNSRLKDYFDVWTLAQSMSFDGATLCEAIKNTFERRATQIESNPIGLSEAMFINTQNAAQWKAFRRRLGNIDAPQEFKELGDEIVAFLEAPVNALVQNEAFELSWSPPGPWAPRQ